MSALALFARTWRRHGFRASVVKALARTMHRRILIEGVDDDFPRPPPPRELAMPSAADAGFDLVEDVGDVCGQRTLALRKRATR